MGKVLQLLGKVVLKKNYLGNNCPNKEKTSSVSLSFVLMKEIRAGIISGYLAFGGESGGNVLGYLGPKRPLGPKRSQRP